MARYFLHLHECGTVTTDEEGRDLFDREQARLAAIRAAREIMCAEVQEGRLCLGCAIVIEDDDHREVMRVPFREALTISGL